MNIKPWQGIADLSNLGLTEQMVSTAAYWVDEGQVSARAEVAIAKALIARGTGWQVAGHFVLLPGVKHVAAPVYRLIAKNRHAMPGGTNACKLPK